jgi:hypothetical protein
MADATSTHLRLTDRNQTAEDVAIFDRKQPSDEAIHIVVKATGGLIALNRRFERLGYLVRKYQWQDIQHHAAVQKEESNRFFQEADITGDAVWLDLDCVADRK